MKTPKSERLHIGIFGKRNSGKSSLLNTLTGQISSIVSNIKGTTTDPIYKSMEIPSVGPVVFIDTAGLDDCGDLGEQRIQKSKQIMEQCDGFIYLLSKEDEEFISEIKKKNKPIIFVISKGDLKVHKKVFSEYEELNPLIFIAHDEKSKNELIKKIAEIFYEKKEHTITGNLVKPNDSVLLVIPQDIQAPKGRLILPQVQTIRELIDKSALIFVCGVDNLEGMLRLLKKSPKLIITDSQYFKEVYEKKPAESLLTSFSILFSAYKGDLDYFIKSVKILEDCKNVNKILISEACTHPPMEEDIGTVKIPKLLKKRYGKDFQFDFSRGNDFQNLENYDLIIHCGSCMFNRSHTMSRVKKAKEKSVPMTNYGIIIAYLQGILEEVTLP